MFAVSASVSVAPLLLWRHTSLAARSEKPQRPQIDCIRARYTSTHIPLAVPLNARRLMRTRALARSPNGHFIFNSIFQRYVRYRGEIMSKQCKSEATWVGPGLAEAMKQMYVEQIRDFNDYLALNATCLFRLDFIGGDYYCFGKMCGSHSCRVMCMHFNGIIRAHFVRRCRLISRLFWFWCKKWRKKKKNNERNSNHWFCLFHWNCFVCAIWLRANVDGNDHDSNWMHCLSESERQWATNEWLIPRIES